MMSHASGTSVAMMSEPASGRVNMSEHPEQMQGAHDERRRKHGQRYGCDDEGVFHSCLAARGLPLFPCVCRVSCLCLASGTDHGLALPLARGEQAVVWVIHVLSLVHVVDGLTMVLGQEGSKEIRGL